MPSPAFDFVYSIAFFPSLAHGTLGERKGRAREIPVAASHDDLVLYLRGMEKVVDDIFYLFLDAKGGCFLP